CCNCSLLVDFGIWKSRLLSFIGSDDQQFHPCYNVSLLWTGCIGTSHAEISVVEKIPYNTANSK
ncbi:hypothetical protein CEXT_367221, partial [Caerostris extrusa]